MDLLAVFIFASVIGAGLVAWVIVWTTNRASEAAITRHFKASEYILETGQPPLEWRARPRWRRILGQAPPAVAAGRHVKRLETLIGFFEKCTFYEDDYAREQHLSQLEEVRRAWRAGKIG